jgi:Flp pilus assembly protein TadD
MEKEHVGAKGQDWSLTPAERVLVAGRATVFYASSLVFPVNLTFIYPRWVVNAGEWWQWLFPVGVLGGMVGLWVKRKQLGRGPLAGLFFFAGTLVPALGFVDVYPFRFSFVADHFQYLASIGLLAVVFAGGSVLWQRYRPADRVGLPVARAVVLLVFGGLTLYYTPRYESAQTLWEDTIARNPDCWMAHNNLGELLFERGKYAQAESHYRETVRLKPEEAGHHYNLGKALWKQNRDDEAEKHYREALRLDPDYAAVHFNLGLVLRKRGELDAAADEFREGIRILPTFADAHANLGITLGMKDRHADAIDELRIAADLEPKNPATQFNLARAYLYLDRPADALPFAQRAVQLDPKKPEFRQLLDHLLAGGGKP